MRVRGEEERGRQERSGREGETGEEERERQGGRRKVIEVRARESFKCYYLNQSYNLCGQYLTIYL